MRVPEVLKLKNGLQVCVIPKTNVDSVTIHLKGLAGSNYESPNQIGAAHLLEHLNILKGNRNKILINGGRVLGVTSRDDVLYMVKILKEDVLDGLEFLSHIFAKTDFSSEDISVQKKIVIQEIRRAQSMPEKVVNTLSYKTLFPNDRLAIKNTGYENQVRSLSTKEIISFQEGYYSPNNFVLVACGNIKKENVIPYIRKYFGSIPAGPKSKHIEHQISNGENTQTVKMPGLKQNYVKIGFYGYKTSDDRKYALTILAATLDSFLKNLVREKLGYVYGISCNPISTGSYGIFGIQFSCERDKTQEVIGITLGILNNIQKIIGVRNIEHMKKKLITDFKFRFEKISQIAEYYSDLLNHGTEKQNHIYELIAIRRLSITETNTVAKELINQKPKITVLTN